MSLRKRAGISYVDLVAVVVWAAVMVFVVYLTAWSFGLV